MKKGRFVALVILCAMFALPPLVNVSSDIGASDNIVVSKSFLESYDYHDQIWIQSDQEFHDQAAAELWDGDGSEGDPYIITGYFFDCETQPLRVWHTTVYWIFTDNVIDGVGAVVQCGTWIENATNGAIVDNEIFNRHVGISISVSENFLVSGNYIHDCWGTGIELLVGSNKTIIKDNIIEDIGAAGIYSSTSKDCVVENNTISRTESLAIALIGQAPNCNISDNTISDCNSKGIMMSQTSNGFVTGNSINDVVDIGIHMNGATESVIEDNSIGYVNGVGIRIVDGDDCLLLHNNIENCTEDGILVSSGTESAIHCNSIRNVSAYAVKLGIGSSENSVSFNTFVENGVTKQVCDDGLNNGVSKNYYSDWNSPDANSDGYVDSPYILDGTAGNQDDLPLAEAGVVPTIEPSQGSNQMVILLIGGAAGVVILIAAALMIKRR